MADDESPSVEEIHRVHEMIEERWDLSHRGTRAIMPDRTLQSILDDIRDLDQEYRRAAALLNRLADTHVYEDGNKRTAWTVAEASLDEVGREAVPSDDVAARVMVNRGRFDEDELARWLESGDIPEEGFRDAHPPDLSAIDVTIHSRMARGENDGVDGDGDEDDWTSFVETAREVIARRETLLEALDE